MDWSLCYKEPVLKELKCRFLLTIVQNCCVVDVTQSLFYRTVHEPVHGLFLC